MLTAMGGNGWQGTAMLHESEYIAMPWHAMANSVTSWHVMTWDVMPCGGIPWHIITYQGIAWHRLAMALAWLAVPGPAMGGNGPQFGSAKKQTSLHQSTPNTGGRA